MKLKSLKYIIFVCLFILSSSIVFGQSATVVTSEITEKGYEEIKIERLKKIRHEMVVLQSELNSLKKSKNAEGADLVTKLKAESKINKIKISLEKKRFDFIEIVTNVNLNNKIKSKKKTDFSDDLKQIIDPALDSFKKISERPRRIQELKDQVDVYSKNYTNAQLALKKLEDTYKKNEHKELKYILKRSIRISKKILKESKNKLQESQFKLLKLEKNQESIVTTFSKLVLEFIKTKGKNLILSFMTFLVVFWSFRAGRNKVMVLLLFRLNRSKNKERYNWVIRPIKVIYGVFSLILSIFFSILTLYVLNDWVLVTFVIFVLAALIWSSKQYLPLFFEQSKIILNLGAIRESERLVYEGLPWKIQSLGYYCRLVNPSLSGGDLRVSTRELLSSHSRPLYKQEPWFPCDEDDWIQTGELFGKVLFQSPEQVIIQKVGSDKVYLNTVEFYQSSPLNLSKGFSVEIIFGLDYSHQADILKSIIPTVKESLLASLREIYGKSIKDFSVEFHAANASSLDLRIFIKCSGDLAAKKLQVERFTQTRMVEICNENDYVIPFNQLTVHMEK